MTALLLGPRDGVPDACALPHADSDAAAFARRFPTFDPDGSFAALRAADYGRLDAEGHAYLDHTGGGLHAASQVDEHVALLRSRVLGNPHSGSPSSLASTELLAGARRDVLEFFRRAATDRVPAAVRVSVGLSSSPSDVFRLVRFRHDFVDSSEHHTRGAPS